MNDDFPPSLMRNAQLIGLFTIAISLITWGMDLAEFVYACPYCRVQRTVIGILGLLMLSRNYSHWVSRYTAAVVGVIGLGVAVMQNFEGWKQISNGNFEWGEYWYMNTFVLSGGAIVIIVGQLKFLHQSRNEDQLIEARDSLAG